MRSGAAWRRRARDRPGRLRATATAAVGALLPGSLLAQDLGGPRTPPPVADTIVVERGDVFPPEVAQGSFIFRGMNAIHVVTQEPVIRRELLFRQGEPLDTALVAESERNLREMRIFREIEFDTVRVDDRLAVRLRTRDGWSLKPKLKLGAASDGTFTGTFGINETNLLGTGNQVYAAYDKQVDRDGLNASAAFSRPFGSAIDVGGNYAGLSDGKNGNWYAGFPLRSIAAPWGLEHDGLAADQEVIRYRDLGTERDSAVFRREALILDLNATKAFAAGPRGYLRAGLHAGFRKESYSGSSDPSASVPDSAYGAFGVFGELLRARYWTVDRLNGFGEEDVDLSTRIRLGLNLAPSWLGYERTGIGSSVGIASGAPVAGGRGYLWGGVDASALWSSAGLDSARVLVTASAGWKTAPRHATVLQVQGGLLERTPPGSEFDLGYTNAPRSWEPHAFVGTRGVWGTLEHRWFRFRDVLQLADIALAAFVDYGGAWYSDQDARFGGSLGFGLRAGSALASVARTGRLDIGWRFGDGTQRGSRFVVSLGSGFVFPHRSAPVVSYRAEPPD